MVEEIPDDAMVIRFRPIDPARLLERADKERRRSGFYRLSVFVGIKFAGESDDAVIARLLAASEISGIQASGNPDFWVCSEAMELSARGFEFYKDGDVGEVDEHYSVDLGDRPTLDDVRRFLEPFATRIRRPR